MNESNEPQTLFKNEETLYLKAKSIVTRLELSDNPLYTNYSQLFKGFQKIYKQMKLLVKFSDKQQHSFIRELEQAFESFILTLVTTIEAKHKYTAGHTQRVTEYAVFLGKCLELSQEDLNNLKYASLLHDIGKIGIPDVILTKSGPFDPEERKIMNEHPLWTFRISSSIKLPRSLKNVPLIAACHHEKIDGTGYPYGLKGDEIPFLSKIIAVSDVFDALTSYRDYPKYDDKATLGFSPMLMESVFKILEKDTDTHFDAIVVESALRNKEEFRKLAEQLFQPLPSFSIR